MAHATHLFFILSFLLPLSSAIAVNVLLSGNILPPDGRLSTRNAVFTISSDCNLALIHNQNNLLFQSNTKLRGTNCSLTLTDRGQLLILSSNGSTIWSSSSPPGKTGQYAALLRPDGHVAVYGPSIWSTPHHPIKGRSAFDNPESSNSPGARNLMFSSQVLYGDSRLASGEHVLAMKDDCNLELVKGTEEGVLWESDTKGMGSNCFLRLDHRGQMAVVDDRLKVRWSSKPAEADGIYVLMVHKDGQVGVYGPTAWSTAS